MHLENLGLDDSADMEDVKTAYKRLAKMYHPDLYTGDDGSKFREIKASYDWLMKNHRPRPKPTGAQAYYEIVGKKCEEVTVYMYEYRDTVEVDSDIWIMRGMEEYLLHVKKGTKIPTKLVITNAYPNITVHLKRKD